MGPSTTSLSLLYASREEPAFSSATRPSGHLLRPSRTRVAALGDLGERIGAAAAKLGERRAPKGVLPGTSRSNPEMGRGSRVPDFKEAFFSRDSLCHLFRAYGCMEGVFCFSPWVKSYPPLPFFRFVRHPVVGNAQQYLPQVSAVLTAGVRSTCCRCQQNLLQV